MPHRWAPSAAMRRGSQGPFAALGLEREIDEIVERVASESERIEVLAAAVSG
jgi:hypothetical protein